MTDMPHPDTSILLVEDNDLDAMVMHRLMRRLSLDYPIVRARDGEQALDILRPTGSVRLIAPPFVMMLDINMPRMSGFELLDALAGDEILARTPIFIVSTSIHPNDRNQARQYQIQGYVVKPVTEPQLIEILDSTDAQAPMNIVA